MGLLLADLFILWFAMGGLWQTDAPTWFRVASGVVAALAVSLAVRSLTLLLRARCRRRSMQRAARPAGQFGDSHLRRCCSRTRRGGQGPQSRTN